MIFGTGEAIYNPTTEKLLRILHYQTIFTLVISAKISLWVIVTKHISTNMLITKHYQSKNCE